MPWRCRPPRSGGSPNGTGSTPSRRSPSWPRGACSARRVAAPLSIAIGLTLLASLSAYVLTGPRVAYAMARAGHFPAIAGRLSARSRTPAVATALQVAWALVLLWTGSFESIVIYAGVGLALFSMLAVSSVYVLRRTRPDLPRPFRTPGYPIVPAFFLTVMGLLTSPPSSSGPGSRSARCSASWRACRCTTSGSDLGPGRPGIRSSPPRRSRPRTADVADAEVLAPSGGARFGPKGVSDRIRESKGAVDASNMGVGSGPPWKRSRRWPRWAAAFPCWWASSAARCCWRPPESDPGAAEVPAWSLVRRYAAAPGERRVVCPRPRNRPTRGDPEGAGTPETHRAGRGRADQAQQGLAGCLQRSGPAHQPGAVRTGHAGDPERSAASGPEETQPARVQGVVAER